MSEVINNRYEFVLFFDVENGNPNGDPDMGNMPRVDPQTMCGLVTDVCLKRKVRDYVEITRQGVAGYDIYVRSGAVLNKQNEGAYIAINKPVKNEKQKPEPEATQFMCRNFYDVRTFGAVMSTEANCGQVRGAIQLCFARSIDPIFPQELTITRCAVTKEVDAEKAHTMGKKQIVPYGLYRVEGFVSAHFAKQTGFTEEDLEVFWESLMNLFEHDHSATRGKMAARKLFVFKHENKLGCCQAHILFDKVKVEKLCGESLPKSLEDYRITVEADLPKSIELIEKL